MHGCWIGECWGVPRDVWETGREVQVRIQASSPQEGGV